MLYQKAHSDDRDRLDMANFILVSCQIQLLTKVTLNLLWPLTKLNLMCVWNFLILHCSQALSFEERPTEICFWHCCAVSGMSSTPD